MFLGVIHSNARRILARYIPDMPAHVHNLCSGNFTIETTLRMNGYRGSLTGCDVSLYTCALGNCFSGQPMRLELTAPEYPELEPLRKYLNTGEGRAAAVSLVLDLSRFASQKNHFQRRMWAANIARLDDLAERTIGRVAKKKEQIRLNGFAAQDAMEYMRTVPPGPDHLVIASPPTYAGGYEKLYKFLDGCFSWDRPVYGQLVSGAAFAQRMIERDGPWIMFAEERIPDQEAILGPPRAQAARGSLVKVYMYTNIRQPVRVVNRKMSIAPSHRRRLSDADELRPDSVLTIHQIPSDEANYIRAVYSSAIPLQAGALWNYALAIDGKLAGLMLFRLPQLSLSIEGKPIPIVEYMYMLSDLAVSSERYPRLSKLVAMAALSAEMQHELSARSQCDVKYLFTTAFSKNPTSMKYRGPYKLHSRTKRPDGINMLNYYGVMGQMTLAEVYAKWWNQYNQSRPAEASTDSSSS